MKIIAVNDDTSERVLFSEGEELPNEKGLLADDGYYYKHVDGKTYVRRLRLPAKVDETIQKAYEMILKLANIMPDATVNDLATAVQKQLGKEYSKAVIDSALSVVLDELYQHAVRFADNPGQLAPKTTEKLPLWPEVFRNKEAYAAILERAARHIDGKGLADTPFASVARSEGQFLRNAEVSACGIIFGSESTGAHKQAKFIYHLRLPKRALITPEELVSLKKISPAVAMMTIKETEALFYGTGLSLYIVAWRPNPYTRADQYGLQITEAMLKEQEELEKEELAKEKTLKEKQKEVATPPLLTPTIKGNWEAFQGTVLIFLTKHKAYIKRTYDIDLDSEKAKQALWGKSLNPLGAGPILRPLDEKLLTDKTLNEEWAKITHGFRQK